MISALDDVYKEIEIMKQMNHQNVVKLSEIIDDPFQDKLYLVMPLSCFGESMSYDSSTSVFIPNSKLQ